MLLSSKGTYAAKIFMQNSFIVGKKDGAFCVTFESCALTNLGYKTVYELGPGEIILLTPDGIEQISPPRDKMKICSFLWVYFDYLSSAYQGIKDEIMRNINDKYSTQDKVDVDYVCGPRSGIAHAIGYSTKAKIPYARPFVKYTPTWSRSLIPKREVRQKIAKMKLMPITDLIEGKRLLFCDDSIVRGTQMSETAQLLYSYNAKEVHIRSACPPLIFNCKYLNFSRMRTELDLAARRAIKKLQGNDSIDLDKYCDHNCEEYKHMVDHIAKQLGFSSLKYQALPDMLDAIGLPHENLCTYCWNGKS